jgi:hypothetical protein
LAVSVVLLAAGLAGAVAIENLYMVGMGGADPDTASPDPIDPSASPKDWCELAVADTCAPAFDNTNLSLFGDRIEADLDLLISESLSGSFEVSSSEKRLLLLTLDGFRDNRLGVEQPDLGLIVDYFSATTDYDSLQSPHFLLFPECGVDSVAVSERSHFDFYLIRKEYDGDAGGAAESRFTDMTEDPPQTPGYREYHRNSFHVSAGPSNAAGDTTGWPVRAAVDACHEICHLLWNTDLSVLGSGLHHGNTNELLACAGAYVAKSVSGENSGNDVPYAQSLIWKLGSGCNPAGPGFCPGWADYQDCRYGYHNWAMWSAYLVEHFSDPLDYTNDLLYGWVRATDDSGRMTRDMCGLARVLDNSEYDHLGGDEEEFPGGYRLAKVFHDYSVAKWIDDESYSEEYCFGDDLSVVESFELFEKNDTNYGDPNWTNCWEVAVPPIFVLGAEHDSGAVWSVPGNASDSLSDCLSGWNDPRDVNYCTNTYCDSVKVRLWGSYYIAFVADTSYYNAGKSNRYLHVDVAWPSGEMDEDVELWVSLIKYSAGDTLLYDEGDGVTHVATKVFSPGDTGFEAAIHDFHKGGNEAGALAMSLVATSYDTAIVNCGLEGIKAFACLPRTQAVDRDLSFSYSFSVRQEATGGGCPLLQILTPEGSALTKNNILAGCRDLLSDGTDWLVLDDLAPEDTCCLRIIEGGDDDSHFDQISLFAVDLRSGEAPATTQEGDLVAYRITGAAVRCLDSEGRDVTDLIADNDGRAVAIPAGGFMEVILPASEMRGGGVGTRGRPSVKIEDPWRSREVSPNALDLTANCLRTNPCTIITSLPDLQPDARTLRVLLTSPREYHLDHLFLASSRPVDDPTTCPLLSAVHSEQGDCSASLSASDDSRRTLAPGERIDLRFGIPAAPDSTRRAFALLSEGRYSEAMERTAESDPLVGRPDGSLHAAVWPNPARRDVWISFTISGDERDVSLDVFNLSGRLVRRLGSQRLAPGDYEVPWDGRDESGTRVASGVYFMRVSAGTEATQSKVLLIR